MSKFALALFLMIPLFSGMAIAATGDMLVYVGGYTNKGGKGIQLFKLGADHKLVPAGLAAETPNPSFLALDEKRRLLFSVSEMTSPDGKKSGAVSSFAIQPDGMLKLLSQQSTVGAGPCHLALDKDGKSLFAANYSSGSVAMLPVAADGMLSATSDFKQHEGQSVNPDRQKGPHAHCVTFDPAGQFLFVCDLGLDKVMIYKIDAANGKLIANDPPFATVKPGSGPRHIAFSPDAKFAYVINEMGNSVTAFTYDAKTGAMSEVQTIETLPESFTGQNTCAEIVVHPSGKFLYASNRGDDSVITFAIDAEKGTLTNIGRTSTGGKVPRFVGLDPSGTFMVMCNQNSSSIESATIDPATGQLTVVEGMTETPSPTCAVFLPSNP